MKSDEQRARELDNHRAALEAVGDTEPWTAVRYDGERVLFRARGAVYILSLDEAERLFSSLRSALEAMSAPVDDAGDCVPVAEAECCERHPVTATPCFTSHRRASRGATAP